MMPLNCRLRWIHHMITNLNELNPMQRTQVGMIYDELARLLPVEGKDYTLGIDFMPNGRLSLSVRGLTPFGTQWATYCSEELPRRLQKNGST